MTLGQLYEELLAEKPLTRCIPLWEGREIRVFSKVDHTMTERLKSSIRMYGRALAVSVGGKEPKSQFLWECTQQDLLASDWKVVE